MQLDQPTKKIPKMKNTSPIKIKTKNENSNLKTIGSKNLTTPRLIQ